MDPSIPRPDSRPGLEASSRRASRSWRATARLPRLPPAGESVAGVLRLPSRHALVPDPRLTRPPRQAPCWALAGSCKRGRRGPVPGEPPSWRVESTWFRNRSYGNVLRGHARPHAERFLGSEGLFLKGRHRSRRRGG